jgi:ATP-dependent DNA helicase RecG
LSGLAFSGLIAKPETAYITYITNSHPVIAVAYFLLYDIMSWNKKGLYLSVFRCESSPIITAGHIVTKMADTYNKVEELRGLMKIGKETEVLEFKKTTAELKEGVVSMSAILNKHGGGEMYFGVRNDGTVVGQQIGEATLRDISQAVSNHLEPKVFPNIELVYLDDKPCIHVTFNGDGAPYFAYGRAYIRVADEDKQMPPTELEGYFLRKNARTSIWDSDLSDKTEVDVDDAVLREYLERANQADRIDFAYTTKEDVLRRLDVIENGRLRNAANALYVGWPLLEVQMAIFAGTQRLTFNDIQRESGSVTTLIRTAERYIRSYIRWRVVFDGSLQRKEIPEIPMDAVREAIINSFCHKDYKSSQNNTISIYSNRVEIYNPGTFPDGLTPEDFIEGSELSVKRNPLLAQLMYYVKDIESFGTGLKRITDACDAAGVKVEFKMLKLGFSVIFYRPDISISDDGIGDSIGENIGANETQRQIIAIMSENSKISAKAIALEIGIAPRNVEANIKILKQAKIIDRVGTPKGGYWVVNQNGDTRGGKKNG